MRGDAKRPTTLDFIEHFPHFGVMPRDGKRTLWAISSEGGLDMRDPVAYSLLQRFWYGDKDVEFCFREAFAPERTIELLDYSTLGLVGRDDLFLKGELGDFVRELSCQMWGRYVIPHSGNPVDCIRYPPGHTYRRRQFAEVDKRRYFDIDYGFIIYHPIVISGRRVNGLNLCGFGNLGTGLMTKILCEPLLRVALREQAETLVHDHSGLRPDLGYEVVVKLWLPDTSNLGRLLDGVMKPVRSTSLDELPFRFQVELLAIAREDGSPEISVATVLRLELHEEPSGEGIVSLGSWSKRLPRRSFQLVRMLNGKPRGLPVRVLAAALYPDKNEARGEANVRTQVYRANPALVGDDPPGQRRAWIESWGDGFTLHVSPNGG